jgi:hypothetical protein
MTLAAGPPNCGQKRPCPTKTLAASFRRKFHTPQLPAEPFVKLSRPLKMAGIKRRQADDTEKTDSKKLKTSSTSKADKKFALKIARKDVKLQKPAKTEDKNAISRGEKPSKAKDKPTKENKSKSTKESPKKKRKEESESDQSDAHEDEDEFQGFAEDDTVKPAFAPLSDDEEEEDDPTEEQPAKKVKNDVKADAEGANKNGMVNGMIRRCYMVYYTC